MIRVIYFPLISINDVDIQPSQLMEINLKYGCLDRKILYRKLKCTFNECLTRNSNTVDTYTVMVCYGCKLLHVCVQSCIYSAPSIYRQHLFRADFGIKARVAI